MKSPNFSLSPADLKSLWGLPKEEINDLEFIKETAVKMFTSAVLRSSVAKEIRSSKYPGLDLVGREGVRGELILKSDFHVFAYKMTYPYRSL